MLRRKLLEMVPALPHERTQVLDDLKGRGSVELEPLLDLDADAFLGPLWEMVEGRERR